MNTTPRFTSLLLALRLYRGRGEGEKVENKTKKGGRKKNQTSLEPTYSPPFYRINVFRGNEHASDDERGATTTLTTNINRSAHGLLNFEGANAMQMRGHTCFTTSLLLRGAKFRATLSSLCNR